MVSKVCYMDKEDPRSDRELRSEIDRLTKLIEQRRFSRIGLPGLSVGTPVQVTSIKLGTYKLGVIVEILEHSCWLDFPGYHEHAFRHYRFCGPSPNGRYRVKYASNEFRAIGSEEWAALHELLIAQAAIEATYDSNEDIADLKEPNLRSERFRQFVSALDIVIERFKLK